MYHSLILSRLVDWFVIILFVVIRVCSHKVKIVIDFDNL